MTQEKNRKKILVAVSGGFDPIHPGHIRMFAEAKSLGDELVVILNNDNWLMKKKGYAFMNEKERKEVIESIRYVDRVIFTKHRNPSNPAEMSVSHMLKEIRPDIYANGGDRNQKNAADPRFSLYADIKTCQKLAIKIVYNVGKGGKIQSSSALVDTAVKTAPRKVAVKIKRKK